MVAITVILAAVIGAFVLDIGGSQESAPQVQWDWADGDSEVTLEHGGGDTVNNPGQITLQSSDTDAAEHNKALNTAELFGDDVDTVDAGTPPATIDDIDGTGTLTLVWESSDGSQSTELSNHDYDV